MMTERQGKILATVSFLLISISIFFTQMTNIPNGPWLGLYSTFTPTWILLIIAAVILLIIPKLSRIRILGSVLIITTISLMTLRWGTVFGIRDPWIHLGYIQDGNYITESRYLAFHLILELLSIVTGTSTYTLILGVSLFAVSTGVIILSAVASRLSNRNLEMGSIAALTLLPLIAIDFNNRPITLAAVLVLTLVLLTLIPFDWRLKTMSIITAAIVFVMYHPLILLLFLLLVANATIYSILSSQITTFKSVIGLPPQSIHILTRGSFVATTGTIFVTYFFYWRPLGQQIASNAIASFLISTSNTSTESAGGSAAVLYNIPMHLQETLAMAALVIITGILSLVGYLLSRKDETYRFISLLAISSVGCLIGLFVIVDLLSPSDFPAIRAVPLAPIILALGAIIGVRQLNQVTKIATPLFIIIIVIGFAVMFPSPLTGTFQQSSTPSDIDRTDWLVDHKGSGVVIEAENTYEITRAKYGSAEVDRLANGDTWDYQSTTRAETYPWKVESSTSNTLIVNHELTRLNAEHDGVREESVNFESNSNKIYAGGNSDVFWEYDFQPLSLSIRQ